MNKTKWIISLIISFSMTSCFGLFDSGTKTIKGKFKLVWIDLQETQGIVESYDNSGSGSQIVPEYVFSVGHNDDFIIAKQHPTSGFDKGYEIDTTILNYFIVCLIKNYLCIILSYFVLNVKKMDFKLKRYIKICTSILLFLILVCFFLCLFRLYFSK